MLHHAHQHPQAPPWRLTFVGTWSFHQRAHSSDSAWQLHEGLRAQPNLLSKFMVLHHQCTPTALHITQFGLALPLQPPSCPPVRRRTLESTQALNGRLHTCGDPHNPVKRVLSSCSNTHCTSHHSNRPIEPPTAPFQPSRTYVVP